jgi:hypothetical protein
MVYFKTVAVKLTNRQKKTFGFDFKRGKLTFRGRFTYFHDEPLGFTVKPHHLDPTLMVAISG